jgi:hypothetical protein
LKLSSLCLATDTLARIIERDKAVISGEWASFMGIMVEVLDLGF